MHVFCYPKDCLIKYGQEKLHSRNHFDPQKGHYPVEIELIFLSINSTRLKLWANGNNAQFNLFGHGSGYKWSWIWPHEIHL